MTDYPDHEFDDDRDRVSRDDDYLRDASVLLDDGEVLITPVEDYEPFSRREYRALYAKHAGTPERIKPR